MGVRRFLLLLGACSSYALGFDQNHRSLQPENVQVPKPAQLSAQTPTIFVQATEYTLSIGESSFIVLAVAFVGVCFLMFVIQYISNTRSKDDLDKSADEGLLNSVTLANIKQSLSFTPVVCLLILFLVFRAETQGITLTNEDYKTLEVGFLIVTAGLLLQSFDGFLFFFESPKVATVLEFFGTLLTYSGFGFLLWGMATVKSNVIPLSVAGQCFFAMAALLIVLLVATKVLQLKARFAAESVFSGTGFVSQLLSEQVIDEIRACASFVPVLMIAFFYLHFRYLRIGNLPYSAEIGMQGATVGIFAQALSVPIRSCSQLTGRLMRLISVVLTYVFFAATVLAGLDAGWPAPSLAVEVVLVLLFLMGFLKLVMVISQEMATFRLNSEETTESSSASLVKTSKLFQDMMSTTDYSTIICILCLYVHFRASFLLRVEPSEYVLGYGHLSELLYLALVGTMLQMLFQLIECGVGAHPVFGLLQTFCLVLVNIGIGGLVIVSAIP